MPRKCVNIKDVPCPKAQDYLRKHGLICGEEPKEPVRAVPKRVKSFLKEWLE